MLTAGEIITRFQNLRQPPFTDAELARLIGISASTICRIKKGEREPSNKTWNLMWVKTPRLHQMLQDFYHGGQ